MARAGAAGKPVDQHDATQHLNEVAGVLTLAAAAFAMVSFVAFHLGASERFGGVFGEALATLLVRPFGFGAYVVPLAVANLGVRVFRRGLVSFSLHRALAVGVLLLASCSGLGLLDMVTETQLGGWMGGFLASVLQGGFGSAGAVVVSTALLLLSAMFLTGSSLREMAGQATQEMRAGLAGWRPFRWRREGSGEDEGEEEPEILLEEVCDADSSSDGLGRDEEPVIVLREVVALRRRRRGAVQGKLPFPESGNYSRPPLDSLDEPRQVSVPVDEAQLQRTASILEHKLRSFKIEGKVVDWVAGPVITTFELEPAAGVKVNQIVNLQDDLTMALRATGVRIVAPIPGKAVVGIEVANESRETVFLRELAESEAFEAEDSSLALCLGKDSAGEPVVQDLARMPHLLIAGATGTGKSVALNAVIMSLLMKASPRDVRFVMIDLKMLELSLYEDLPHQLVPVITDPKKAITVLKNLCDEMDRRYLLLKDKGVRNIDNYNRVVGQTRPVPTIDLLELADGEDDLPGYAPVELRHEYLPKIVVIIDELAELMMTSQRQVEDPITRLAQKARACGIHLILATQRPSVDVITGLIKANFPARMSFKVTSRVDSRTILDSIGAERLLGQGDMLFLSQGTSELRRMHGAYVSEEEIQRVTEFIRRQGSPEYAMHLLEGKDDASEEGVVDDEDGNDELYDRAVHEVTTSRNASISWLQRRLRVGYNRSARLVERLEREGVVSRSENGRPREVLAPPPVGDDE